MGRNIFIMLREEGLVISVSGSEALVQTQRSEACHHCGARGACDAMGGSKSVEFMVNNAVQARSGDRVELALPESTVLKASIIAYAIPLAAMLVGAILGQFLAGPLGWKPDSASIVLGGIGLALSAVAVLALNRSVARKAHFTPRITRILPPRMDAPDSTQERAC